MIEHYFINPELGAAHSLAAQYEQFSTNFEITRTEEIETALQAVHNFVGTKAPSIIMLESTPVYAVPHFSSQSLNDPSAMAAIHISSKIRGLVSNYPTEHWVMLDDYNYGAKNINPEEITSQFNALSHSIPLYRNIDRLARESEFNMHPDDTCSNMDSRFQYSKLTKATQHWELPDQNPLLINVHPTDFWGQQRQMLERLIKTVRGEPALSHLGKETKRNMVLDSFLHVWTSNTGALQVTKPALHNGEVRHIPIYD